MERIRAAIDKARAERQVTRGEAVQLAGRTRQGAAGAKMDPDTAWQALGTAELKSATLSANRIVTHEPRATATPFDAMRTQLMHELRRNNWRRVAITSPDKNCGKTTVCMNLAFSLARQPDLRVMVIELDLRRPSIGAMLGIDASVDFGRAMQNEAPADEQIRRIRPNLAVAVSRPTPQSAELLQSLTAAHVIDAVEAQYRPDVMLFDLPPMLMVDDALGFIDQVDATLMVAAAESSTIDQVSRSKQELQDRTNLLGVVLNKCRFPDPAGSYTYRD